MEKLMLIGLLVITLPIVIFILFDLLNSIPKYKVGDIVIIKQYYEPWEDQAKAIILEVGKHKYRYKFWDGKPFGEDQSKEFDRMHRIYTKL